MPKHTAIYLRVSTEQQKTDSQETDLRRYAETVDGPVKWYRDKFSGKTMDRPAWKALEAEIRAGRVAEVVVWRLDRLGRTVSGLSALFDDLQARNINLHSEKDGLDLSTPSGSTSAGRLLANVLASMAQYETEIRAERVKAGQAVARANGKRWGGSEKGKPKVVTPDKAAAIFALSKEGKGPTAIARAVSLSRPTIYEVLRHPERYAAS